MSEGPAERGGEATEDLSARSSLIASGRSSMCPNGVFAKED
jgi:hypothetical protein